MKDTIWRNYRTDLAANEGNWRGKIIVSLFRFSQFVRGSRPKVNLIRGLILGIVLLVEWILGCEISPKAKIGPGFVVYHPIGIVVGPVVVGRNFVIRQNCTVGKRHKFGGGPIIGDNVEMGANSHILGEIEVVNGSTLGANSLLIQNALLPGTYVGNPAILVDQKR